MFEREGDGDDSKQATEEGKLPHPVPGLEVEGAVSTMAAVSVMVSQPPGQLVAHVEEPTRLFGKQPLQLLGSCVHCDYTRLRRRRWSISAGRTLRRRLAILHCRSHFVAPLFLDRASAFSERIVLSVRRFPGRLGFALYGAARLDDRTQRRRLSG